MTNDGEQKNIKQASYNKKTKTDVRRRRITRSKPGQYLGCQLNLPDNNFEFSPDPEDKGSKPIKDFEPKK